MTATGYRERDSSSFVLESNCSKAVHNQPHHAITTTESPLMYHKINSDIVLSDKLYYFDSSTKKWRLRTFRFDGRHLVCLRKTKYSGKKIPQKGNKVNPDLLTSIHCDTSSIDFEDEKHSKMYRSPQKSFCTSSEGKFSPNMLSPMFATPKSSWDMITAKDDDDKPGSSVPVLDAGYYQLPKFVIDMWKISSMSVVSKRLPTPTLSVMELFSKRSKSSSSASRYFSANSSFPDETASNNDGEVQIQDDNFMHSRRAVKFVFVIHCQDKNIVLRSPDQRSFDTWLFVLSRALKDGEATVQTSTDAIISQVPVEERGRALNRPKEIGDPLVAGSYFKAHKEIVQKRRMQYYSELYFDHPEIASTAKMSSLKENKSKKNDLVIPPFRSIKSTSKKRPATTEDPAVSTVDPPLQSPIQVAAPEITPRKIKPKPPKRKPSDIKTPFINSLDIKSKIKDTVKIGEKTSTIELDPELVDLYRRISSW